MLKRFQYSVSFLLVFCLSLLSIPENVKAQTAYSQSLSYLFRNPPEDAKPWTFWYWMYGLCRRQELPRTWRQ